jgi:hypothetical protein
MSDTNGNGKAGLHAALIQARASIGAIPKTATNPHYKNRYAPLGTVLAHVLPPMAANDLSLSSRLVDGPALVVEVTYAPTGEVISSTVPLLGATDMQKLGGAISYAERYGIGALLSLELEDDDDGNRASGRGGPPAKQERKPAAPAPTSTAKPVDPHAHISPERAKKLSAFRMSLGADAWKESPHSDIATAELTNEQADEIGRWHVNRSKATPAPHVESRAPEVPGEEPSTAGAGEDNGLPFGDVHVPESLTVEQVERLAAAKARRARS